jgi:hypothetical protein
VIRKKQAAERIIAPPDGMGISHCIGITMPIKQLETEKITLQRDRKSVV